MNKVVIGIGGGILVAGTILTIGIVRIVNTVKNAHAAGLSIKDYKASKKKVEKAAKEKPQAEDNVA
jgi:hypothetical protein